MAVTITKLSDLVPLTTKQRKAAARYVDKVAAFLLDRYTTTYEFDESDGDLRVTIKGDAGGAADVFVSPDGTVTSASTGLEVKL